MIRRPRLRLVVSGDPDQTAVDIERYTTYLLATAELATTTTDEYASYVRRWFRWARTRDLDPHRPAARGIREWSDGLPPGVSSRDNAKAAIKHLCQMCGVPDVSGAVGRPEKNARNLRMPLTRREAQQLMRRAWDAGDQGTAVVIGLTTGMRISEIQQFRWEDIDWSHATIRYRRRKTKDRHTIPLAPQLAQRLATVRPDRGTGYVLASPTDGYRSTQGLRDWIKGVAADADLPWVQPHDLRRTSGRAIYEESGRDITVAQKFLGHSDPGITARYIRADLDGVRDAVESMGSFWSDPPDAAAAA